MEDLLQEMIEDYLNEYKGREGDVLALTANLREKLTEFDLLWRERNPEPPDGGMTQWQTNRTTSINEYLQTLLPIPD